LSRQPRCNTSNACHHLILAQNCRAADQESWISRETSGDDHASCDFRNDAVWTPSLVLLALLLGRAPPDPGLSSFCSKAEDCFSAHHQKPKPADRGNCDGDEISSFNSSVSHRTSLKGEHSINRGPVQASASSPARPPLMRNKAARAVSGHEAECEAGVRNSTSWNTKAPIAWKVKCRAAVRRKCDKSLDEFRRYIGTLS